MPANRIARSERPGDPARAYRTLFDGPHAVFVLDVTPDGRFRVVAFNATEERLVGVSNADAAGRYVDELFPECVAQSLLANYRRCVVAEEPIGYEEELDLPSGHRHCATTLVPAFDDEGRLSQIIGVARDVTDEKAAVAALRASEERCRRSEEQLEQAQKLEAIGALGAGVAHDFNNMLSVVLTYTALAMEQMSPHDPVWTDLDEVRRAGERGSALTRQLLALGRKQMLDPRVVDLDRVLEGVAQMLARLVGAGITVSVHAAKPVGSVYVDVGQIEQVITNLVINARDAMPHGGHLTIETGNLDLAPSDAADHDGVAPGRYVVLTITDTGLGMDGATRARIFEPFFTTKAPGKGTGLGLSTAYGIIRQSGGHIGVSSEPGKGTTFRVYLPRTDRAAEAATSPGTLEAAVRGTETVLLVEDDDAVRGTMRSALRRYGYAVLEAQNGGEAFLICEQFAGTIHLLLTDVVMPRMSGCEIARRLAALRPEMQVIYVSGYAETTFALDAGAAFLPKPITPNTLLRKIRDVLDSVTDRTRRPSSPP